MKFNCNTLCQENVPERQGKLGAGFSVKFVEIGLRMNMLLKSGWHCEFVLVADRKQTFWNWHAWK